MQQLLKEQNNLEAITHSYKSQELLIENNLTEALQVIELAFNPKIS
ncbi:unnamed protein product [Paramecium octaurelia]|uniref:Uncharacterized protein n=1 Tax=Paramecium octaurelia TaxID=43137 RepID=A0A8S1VX87_PAROT|nr:unnamed protein product [Paramecium octaurelia]